MSDFGYFCRHKSNSHQLAKRAAKPSLISQSLPDAGDQKPAGGETAFES